jgi:hypothetical protein
LTRSAIELAARGVTTLAEAMISSVSGISDEDGPGRPRRRHGGERSRVGAQLAPERVLSLLA